MRSLDGLGLAQRIVLVIALAAALMALGGYLVSLGSGPVDFGWVGYAPLSGLRPYVGLRPWIRLVVWLVLIAVWAAASLRLLRAPRR